MRPNNRLPILPSRARCCRNDGTHPVSPRPEIRLGGIPRRFPFIANLMTLHRHSYVVSVRRTLEGLHTTPGDTAKALQPALCTCLYPNMTRLDAEKAMDGF